MISIQFGKIKRSNPPRVDVELTGFLDSCVLSGCLAATPGGVSGTKTWFNFAVGDMVCVLFDSEFPQNSIVLGGVYTDGASMPGSSDKGVSIAANTVTIKCDASATVEANGVSVKCGASGAVVAGSNPSAAVFAARSDKVDSNLSAIATSMAEVVTAFATLGVPIPAYTPTSTAATSVKIV